MPKKPEDWLEIASPRPKARGIFKLFLGYAPGVGKTYSMLSEALRRHGRGEDVVIGVIETHGRKAIEELVRQLEIVPRRKIEYKGTIFEEMDVDAILARRPDVVLVDINLGQESGFDLVELLHQDESAAAAVPTILISTHSEEDFADLISASPALAFIPKAALSGAAIRDALGPAA